MVGQHNQQHTASFWHEDEARSASGPFGSPDPYGSPSSSRDHGRDHGLEPEADGLRSPARPRRRDLMAGSRPRPIVPKSLSEAYRIAQAVCAAKMAPKGLETPEACMIAIMHGLEVGLSPLSALQRIAVINGRPTLWGDGALALVKASGLCEAIEEWIEGDDDNPSSWMAVCNLIRKHDPVPVERRFSSADAKRAKLWGKSGPWSDYPKRMLQMRARAFALRDAFPDVLGGLYLTEEFLGEAESSEQAPSSDPSSSPSSGTSWPTSVAAASATASSKASTASAPLSATSSGTPGQTSGATLSGASWPASSSTSRVTSGAAMRTDQTDQVEPGLTAHTDRSDGLFDGDRDNDNEARQVPQNAKAFEPQRSMTSNHTVSPSLADPLSAHEAHEHREDRRDHEADQPHQPDTSDQTYARLPPLANLRRTRSMPREVRALRFRNQWSIRQPKGPRPQPNAAFGDPQTNRTTASSHDDVISPNKVNPIRQNAPGHDEREQQPNSSPIQNPFIPPDDVTAHLDLYDAALCCAQDEETLTEIAEEFTERLKALPIKARQQAQSILKRHTDRLTISPHHGSSDHE